MEPPEAKLLENFTGKKPFFENNHCGYLIDGKCSAYNVRPAICRMFGVSEKLKCPFGCMPEGGLLKERAASRLMSNVRNACGNGEIVFNATAEQASKFIEDSLCHSATDASHTSSFYRLIQNIARNILNRLRSIFNRQR